MRFSKKPKPLWAEGVVNQRAGHVSICYGESRRSVALVAQTKGGFRVQFLLKTSPSDPRTSRILSDVRRELAFYLHDAVGSDSWAYVQYHCDSPANRRSIVHWQWHMEKEGRNGTHA